MNDEVRYPSLDQVKRLYDRVIETTGGESGYLRKSNLEYLLDTVRDYRRKASEEAGVGQESGILTLNVIGLHPFVNGNKRTAYELLRLFLRLNGYEIRPSPEDAYRFLLDVASGKAPAVKVEKWIAMNLTEVKAD